MKYNCEDILAVLDEYLDGETEPLVSSAVEEHLAGCENCRHELEERADMRRIIESAAPTPPEGLHDTIMMKVHAESSRKRRMKLARRIAAVAAAFVLAVGVAAAWISGAAGGALKNDAMAPENAENAEGNAGDAAPGDEAPQYSDKVQEGLLDGADINNGDNDGYSGNGIPFPDEAEGNDGASGDVPEVSDTAIYELRFSEYGKGYNGGLVVYAEDADEAAVKKLARSLGADFNGTALVLPENDAATDAVAELLPGFSDYPSARVGKGEGEQCIIIFIK